MDIGHLKTNSMNRNLCVFERDVDCGIGYIGVDLLRRIAAREEIIQHKLGVSLSSIGAGLAAVP